MAGGKPILAAVARFDLSSIKKRTLFATRICRVPTFKPIAKSLRSLMQRLWHKSAKQPRSASFGARDLGRACWARPSMNSARLNALVFDQDLSEV